MSIFTSIGGKTAIARVPDWIIAFSLRFFFSSPFIEGWGVNAKEGLSLSSNCSFNLYL
jgi:hypothetical protein